MLSRLVQSRLASSGAIQSVEEAREAIAAAKGILLDWDGCVAFGDQLAPTALKLIDACRDRVAIVSNNTTHLPEYFSEHLARQGVALPPGRVVLAGAEALARAARRGAPRTLLIGSPRMKAEAMRLGVHLVSDDADLVVLLRDNRFSYRKLERAVNAIKDGAALIVGNPDLTHPGPHGRLVPETGALLAAVEACLAAQDIAAEVVGKPEAALFEIGCRALGASPGEAVMIGDNPATDMAGALALGMAGVLVGPRSGLSLADLVA